MNDTQAQTLIQILRDNVGQINASLQEIAMCVKCLVEANPEAKKKLEELSVQARGGARPRR